MRTLRTEASQQRYDAAMAMRPEGSPCPLCVAEPLREFEHWKIIPNDYPYDRVADVHHMLVSLRHVPEGELSAEEMRELREIKLEAHLSDDYDCIIEAAEGRQSIPAHFHLHLVKITDAQ